MRSFNLTSRNRHLSWASVFQGFFFLILSGCSFINLGLFPHTCTVLNSAVYFAGGVGGSADLWSPHLMQLFPFWFSGLWQTTCPSRTLTLSPRLWGTTALHLGSPSCILAWKLCPGSKLEQL